MKTPIKLVLYLQKTPGLGATDRRMSALQEDVIWMALGGVAPSRDGRVHANP